MQSVDHGVLETRETQSVLSDKPTYSALLDALDVMQSNYFCLWPGTWPTAIDWTATLMANHITATLSVITDSISPTISVVGNPISPQKTQIDENTINQYFTQITSFYHAENAFALRTQAYDDMLWVVLDWLEGVKFIRRHSNLHYPSSSPASDAAQFNTSIWYAQQFIPQFAHRSHIFYDLASKGWDTTLCSGGMIWNPDLGPYKNSITNQLFVTASVGMYLYFPGDGNSSPFSASECDEEETDGPAKAHDTRYLTAAITAYEWLRSSNITNSQGLYTDGFHISGNSNSSNGSAKCDIRDEKVYTYNQGVILSGLRGLFTATGQKHYLEDGHALVRNVIAATGWAHRNDDDPWVRGKWAGLGRAGVMEEACDSTGTCSQDGQTFKGVFWLHFGDFCRPADESDDAETALMHRTSCKEYGQWVRLNAAKASETKNSEGKFGSWWGARDWSWMDKEAVQASKVGTDYRNEGVLKDAVWTRAAGDGNTAGESNGRRSNAAARWLDKRSFEVRAADETVSDPNDRNRGRTVETQSGGLAVLRALWRYEVWYGEDGI